MPIDDKDWALHYSISNSEASLSHFESTVTILFSLCSFFPPQIVPKSWKVFAISHTLHTWLQVVGLCPSQWAGLWGQVFVHHNLTQCWFLDAAPKCSLTGLREKKLRKCFSTIKSLSIFVKSRHTSLLKWNGLKQMSFGCQTITLTC